MLTTFSNSKSAKHILLCEEHIEVLRTLCESASELGFIEATLTWTEYFDRNYSFFSMMLASKGAPYFRNRFLNFLLDEFRHEVNVTAGINLGLNEEVIISFVASAYAGVVEWWFKNERPVTYQVLAEQLGTLLERNFKKKAAILL